MEYLIWNADTPQGFYIINNLRLRGDNITAVTIGDGKGDIYIHPDTNYVSGIDFCVYLSEYSGYDGIFYIVDHDRVYSDFTGDVKEILHLELPTVVIMDWEIYNGVKRGNLPVHTGTPTSPDSFRGISKVWIKDTMEQANKEFDFPISVLIYPTALSPFSIDRAERIEAEYYLPQKIFEVLEAFKTGENVQVHQGDLRVQYDIIHRSDIARSAIEIIDNNFDGVHMISSNKIFTLEEILETLYGRLVGVECIKLKNAPIEVLRKRRSIENYDTFIDMVYMWSEKNYSSLFSLSEILDEIIKVYNITENSNQIADKVLLHLV